ncbi:helix-turn-helix domain-containing protein [Delftia acidovorans]|uniref:helix-turn-helix domain-containing protein n=1 Tax=Delftia acidovorans TaxID=80866 RepID=UPI003D7F4BF8
MTRVDAEILTVEDLAKLFACDKETAAARLTTGDLPGVKVGRGWIIPRQALFERLNEKAREESAARRAQQANALELAQNRGRDPKTKSSNALTLSPSAYLPVSASKTRGRKRREPPVLPPLTS